MDLCPKNEIREGGEVILYDKKVLPKKETAENGAFI